MDPLKVLFLLFLLQSLSVVRCNPLLSFALPHKNNLANLLINVTQDQEVSVGRSCRASLVEFANGLRGDESNALFMFDSFAKMKPGLFSYQFTNFGNYRQCLKRTDPPARYVVLEIAVNSNDTEYFLGPLGKRHYQYHKPLVAICVPGACSESDVSSVVTSQLVSSLAHPYSLRVLTSELKGEEQFTEHTHLRYFCRLTLAAIVSLNVVSTILLRWSRVKNTTHKIISCFDLVKNTEQIFQEPSASQARTQLFNGVRVVWTLSAMCPHHLLAFTQATKPYHQTINHSILPKYSMVKVSQIVCLVPIYNAILSSALIVISWHSQFKSKKGKVSFFSFINVRLWRIYPNIIAYFLIIGSFPLTNFSSGPLVNYLQKSLIDLLLNHWWRQILLISCFQPISQMAMAIGWFISVDTQLYAASFIVVYFFFNKPKLGVFLAIVMFKVGLIVHWFHLSLKNVTPTQPFFTTRFDQIEDNYQFAYFHIANYVSLYPIGLLLGFLITHKVEISKGTRDKIWWLSVTCICFVSLIPPMIYDVEGKASVTRKVELIATVFMRPIFGAANCALLYYYHLTPSSLVTRFLSCSILRICSRLNFSFFVVHPFLIIFQFAFDVEAKNYNLIDATQMYLCTLLASLPLAYLLFVLVEQPFNLVRQSLFKSRGQIKVN